jgi:hypothetical protein
MGFALVELVVARDRVDELRHVLGFVVIIDGVWGPAKRANILVEGADFFMAIAA